MKKRRRKEIGCPGISQETLTNLFEIRSSHEFNRQKNKAREKNLTLAG
jgi:hypothetical protein